MTKRKLGRPKGSKGGGRWQQLIRDRILDADSWCVQLCPPGLPQSDIKSLSRAARIMEQRGEIHRFKMFTRSDKGSAQQLRTFVTYAFPDDAEAEQWVTDLIAKVEAQTISDTKGNWWYEPSGRAAKAFLKSAKLYGKETTLTRSKVDRVLEESAEATKRYDRLAAYLSEHGIDPKQAAKHAGTLDNYLRDHLGIDPDMVAGKG